MSNIEKQRHKEVTFKKKANFSFKDKSQSEINEDGPKTSIKEENSQSGINESSDKIHFESNDLLDDYKK